MDVTGKRYKENYPEIEKQRENISNDIKILRKRIDELSIELEQKDRELTLKIEAHNALLEAMGKLDDIEYGVVKT